MKILVLFGAVGALFFLEARAQEIATQYSHCDICHYNLNQCRRFGFVDEEEKADTRDFLACFGPHISNWLFRVKAKIRVQWQSFAQGPINREGNRYDRVSCFQYYIYQDAKCIQCGIDHTEGVADLKDASDVCKPEESEESDQSQENARVSANQALNSGRGFQPISSRRLGTQTQVRRTGSFQGRQSAVTLPRGSFPRGLPRNRGRLIDRRRGGT